MKQVECPGASPHLMHLVSKLLLVAALCADKLLPYSHRAGGLSLGHSELMELWAIDLVELIPRFEQRIQVVTAIVIVLSA